MCHSFCAFRFELIVASCLLFLSLSLSLSTEERERIKKASEEKVDILGDEDVVQVFLLFSTTSNHKRKLF